MTQLQVMLSQISHSSSRTRDLAMVAVIKLTCEGVFLFLYHLFIHFYCLLSGLHPVFFYFLLTPLVLHFIGLSIFGIASRVG